MSGDDTFLNNFIKHNSSNIKFKKTLAVNLMQAYVAKVEGVKNPKCASMVLNFLLALLASGNKKAFEYISGKLCSVSIRHMRTLIAKKRNTIYQHDKRQHL